MKFIKKEWNTRKTVGAVSRSRPGGWKLHQQHAGSHWRWTATKENRGWGSKTTTHPPPTTGTKGNIRNEHQKFINISIFLPMHLLRMRYIYIYYCSREMGIGASTFCVWIGEEGRNTLVDSWCLFHWCVVDGVMLLCNTMLMVKK